MTYRDRREYARDYGRKRRKEDPAFRAALAKHKRNYKLRYKYGITEEQFQRHLERCKHSCEICRVPLAKETTAIDHNHATNKFRGILCKKCNIALGMGRDSPAIFRRMAEYLEIQ